MHLQDLVKPEYSLESTCNNCKTKGSSCKAIINEWRPNEDGKVYKWYLGEYCGGNENQIYCSFSGPTVVNILIQEEIRTVCYKL